MGYADRGNSITPTPERMADISGTARTSLPAQRIEDLQSKIYSIARKFQLSEQSQGDIAHYMIERLLTRCAEIPDFISRDDGYWLRFANWMGYHLLHTSITYKRFTIDKAQAEDSWIDPSELCEQAIDLSPERNPEKALELTEIREVINSLPLHNRKLAAMIMIGYTKSEIAGSIGISRSAITQRMETIRKQLAPFL